MPGVGNLTGQMLLRFVTYSLIADDSTRKKYHEQTLHDEGI
jgi:hypothetical protein